jgi:hypothetical protein
MYAYYGLSEGRTARLSGQGNSHLPPGHYPNLSIGEFQQMMASVGYSNQPKPLSTESISSVNQQFGYPPENKSC